MPERETYWPHCIYDQETERGENRKWVSAIKPQSLPPVRAAEDQEFRKTSGWGHGLSIGLAWADTLQLRLEDGRLITPRKKASFFQV